VLTQLQKLRTFLLLRVELTLALNYFIPYSNRTVITYRGVTAILLVVITL